MNLLLNRKSLQGRLCKRILRISNTQDSKPPSLLDGRVSCVCSLFAYNISAVHSFPVDRGRDIREMEEK